MAPDFDLKQFSGNRSLKKAFELNEQLAQRLFIVTDTGIPYRTINHWEAIGLIDDPRFEGERWRRFSFVEFVWLRMIEQMRDIGLKTDSIRHDKDHLLASTPLIDLWTLMANIGNFEKLVYSKATEEEQKEFSDFFAMLLEDPPEGELLVTPLQLLIATAIAKRCPVIAIVFPDGDSFWLEEHPEFFLPDELWNRLSFEPHIRISISGILKEFLASELAFERINKLQLLEENETQILEILHSGQYKRVTINFKDKKMDSLELVKEQETTRKIVDILAESKYQNIKIVNHNGTIANIENTTKIKLPQK